MAKKNLNTFLKDNNYKKTIKSLSFEDGLELIDDLVSEVETGSLDLESSVSSYEKGSELITYLKSLLGDAEGKLEVIKKKAQ